MSSGAEVKRASARLSFWVTQIQHFQGSAAVGW